MYNGIEQKKFSNISASTDPFTLRGGSKYAVSAIAAWGGTGGCVAASFR